MSVLPRNIRLKLAARLFQQTVEQHREYAELDAGFDAGEFSGPAHGRMVQKELYELAARFQLPADEIVDKVIEKEFLVYEDDDEPAGVTPGCPNFRGNC